MKKSILFIAVALFAAACSGNCVINGTVNVGELPDGAYAYISKDGETELAVSELKDGKFSLKVPADPSEMYIVAINCDDKGAQDQAYQAYLIPDGGKIDVMFGEAESSVSGSKATDAFNAFEEFINTEFSAKQQAAVEAYENGDEASADALMQIAYDSLTEEAGNVYDANLNNFAGLNALELILSVNEDITLEEVETLIAKGGKVIKENESIQKMVSAKKAQVATGEGQPFVEIAGKTADGADIRLSDFVGKGDYVLIDFWASWCGPCMRAVPNLRAYLEQYQDKGFKLVGINCWERKEGAGQAKAVEMDMTWPVIFAEDKQVDAYGVEAIPTLILFAPDGTIAGRLTGEAGLAELLASKFE